MSPLTLTLLAAARRQLGSDASEFACLEHARSIGYRDTNIPHEALLRVYQDVEAVPGFLAWVRYA